jgi:hypothetical protein
VRCSTEKLSALADGDLSPRAARRVRAHLDGCVACRRALAEIDEMRCGLALLPPAEAPDDWPLVVRRLQVAPPPARRWRRFVLVPALASVAAAFWLHHHRGAGPSDDVLIAQAETEFRSAEAQYLHALEKLRGVTQRARAGWPEPRRQAYDTAQARLEVATDECRQVARMRPADAEAEALLYAAYRKQIRFFEDQLLVGATP